MIGRLTIAALLLAGCGDPASTALPDLARVLTFDEPDLAAATGSEDMATAAGGDLATTASGDLAMQAAPDMTALDLLPPPNIDMAGIDMAGVDPNLIVYLTFDSVAGTTVHDSSGHGNDGTLQGDAVISAGAGKIGDALSLSGTKAATDVALGDVAPFGGAITIEAWVKPSGAQTAWAQIISRWSNTAGGYWLGGSSPAGNWEFFIAAGGGTSNAALQQDTWQHLAATFTSTGTAGALFINGVRDSGGTLPNTGPGPAKLVVGGNQGADASNFAGLVDEVRIYSVVRTQAQICSDAGGTPGAGATCTLP